MFIRKNASFEIAEAMEKALVSEAVEQETFGLTKIAEAAELLNKAAELFDEAGLHTQAEMTTYLLETLAGKRKPKKKVKNKVKSKSKSKKSDPASSGLTSEKMVDNLAHKGWVFNADDDNDVKLGITGNTFDETTGSPDYWRDCARKALQQGKLQAAEHCLNKAVRAEQSEAYDEGREHHRNEFDDDSGTDVNYAFVPLAAENTSEYWMEKAKYYEEMAEKAQRKGHIIAAESYLRKADSCLNEASKMENTSLDKASVNDMNWAEPMWEKDEAEQDLARHGFDLEDWDKSNEWEDEFDGMLDFQD